MSVDYYVRLEQGREQHPSERFVHPVVGELSLGYESFAIGGALGQILTLYHAEPGSRDERALALLESVAAGETAEQASRSAG